MGPHSFKCGKRILANSGKDFSNASMGPHSFKCGKVEPALRTCLLVNASMGPHSFKCGKKSVLRAMKPDPTSFNGAALFQVRKTIRQYGGGMAKRSFNGAALFQVRKSAASGTSIPAFLGLQWGRTLSSAENQAGWNREVIQYKASMGPHSFKCGK